jgi:methylmalonyl-CoA/ethylmalonyl-CoA epimerase
LHHICLSTSDVRADQENLEEQGYRLLRPEATRGAGGCWVQFIHPASAAGVLLELSQEDAC